MMFIVTFLLKSERYKKLAKRRQNKLGKCHAAYKMLVTTHKLHGLVYIYIHNGSIVGFSKINNFTSNQSEIKNY